MTSNLIKAQNRTGSFLILSKSSRFLAYLAVMVSIVTGIIGFSVLYISLGGIIAVKSGILVAFDWKVEALGGNVGAFGGMIGKFVVAIT